MQTPDTPYFLSENTVYTILSWDGASVRYQSVSFEDFTQHVNRYGAYQTQYLIEFENDGIAKLTEWPLNE